MKKKKNRLRKWNFKSLDDAKLCPKGWKRFLRTRDVSEKKKKEKLKKKTAMTTKATKMTMEQKQMEHLQR